MSVLLNPLVLLPSSPEPTLPFGARTYLYDSPTIRLPTSCLLCPCRRDGGVLVIVARIVHESSAISPNTASVIEIGKVKKKGAAGMPDDIFVLY